MNNILIHNGLLVNEGKIFKASILIQGKKIKHIFQNTIPDDLINNSIIINAKGKYVLPGIIDDQVHFRDPGLTHKADIYTESKAAVAGGVTSFMDMPNTKPQTITNELLEKKYEIASKSALSNYSFYFGATNDNLNEILKVDPATNCGIKIFLGASTGNMLVDNPVTLENIFSKTNLLIAVHCEDENIIQNNIRKFKDQYGENVPIHLHPVIRDTEACYKSSSMAIQLAKKTKTRLHLLHLSTEKETQLLESNIPAADKLITAEVCVHHLWFDDNDYNRLGTLIKWNPAIKTGKDKEALFSALLTDKIDIIATDHAPHTLSEKQNTYFKAPSGGPFVQHSLVTMLEFYHKKTITLEKIVEKMCHTPAEIFRIKNRGFLREGFFADLAIVDLENNWTVNKNNLLYKCKWSPLEGQTFKSKVVYTFVNGNLVYENSNSNKNTGKFYEDHMGERLAFDR